ncbi:hypothetical protein [Bradyrhizobium sp. LHD-71]|uniref:hypothetical protein n=1 Tax=Bradyrhizobium sp. LHD-71 TaxID=3072141 RepID=UPI00280CA48D|nr:hypothetical protein [Bradyrhizobium sp. LHD-71]MDQ8729028.1 hypothetical protein [Bradyrhizobium sp. LHD-71]
MFRHLTSRYSASAKRVRASRGRTALALLAIAFAAGGCVTDQRMNSFAQGSSATVTFDSVDGPPPQVFERFVEALSTEAQAKALPIVSRDGTATYRVRAYLAAQVIRGRTTIAWTFDVYEAGQQRALRLTGEEVAGKPGRDAWMLADAALLRRIAQNGIAGMADLMNGIQAPEPPAAPATGGGPAIAEAPIPPPSGAADSQGPTTLAFQRE